MAYFIPTQVGQLKKSPPKTQGAITHAFSSLFVRAIERDPARRFSDGHHEKRYEKNNGNNEL
jgi:hypothetical protein